MSKIAKIIFEAIIGFLIIYVPAFFILNIVNWPFYFMGITMGDNLVLTVFLYLLFLAEFAGVSAIFYFYMRNKIRNINNQTYAK